MKRSSAFFCGAAFFVVTAPSAEVSRSFDRFKNQTEVSARKATLSGVHGTFNFLWDFLHPGEQMRTKPSTVLFGIMVLNVSWKYLECHSVAFLADGKPVAVERSSHKGSVRPGFIGETISSTLKPTAVSQLAQAKKVEMQLCHTEYTFDEGDMKVLREFNAELNAVK